MNNNLPEAITHTEYKYDGFGENYKTLILTMTFAEFSNIKFLYSPFKELYHTNDYKNFNEKMESMINLKKYLEVVNEQISEKYNVFNVRRMDLLSFFDNNIDFFEKSKTIKLIKSAFKEKNINPWKRETKYDYTNDINIAIHIRRPDIYDRNLYRYDYDDRLSVPSSLYVTIIKQFLACYNNVKIHIYSQLLNNQSEFDLYKSIDQNKIVLHIDEPLDKTFIEMVYADILVMAPSALSYTAAVLSDSIIYYIPFNCPPLSHWNIVQGYRCSNLYSFVIKSVDLDVTYNSKTGVMNVDNLDDLRYKTD